MKVLPLVLLATVGLTACVDTDSVSEAPVANQTFDLMDQDSDGVINARDLCADTLLGASINNDGCPASIIVEEEESIRVLFANNRTEILPAFYAEIEKMAEFLAKYPDMKLRLRGHASQTGPKERNIELSEQRAQVVHDMMIEKYGVNPEQLELVWYGADKPQAQGKTEMDHAQNRRVVGSLVGEYADDKMKWTVYTAREDK